MIEKGYQGVFESLPKEKQSVIIGRKADFAQKAEIRFRISFKEENSLNWRIEMIGKALYHAGLFLFVHDDKKKV